MKKLISTVMALALSLTMATSVFAGTHVGDYFYIASSGEGTINVSPDIAYVSIAISTTGETSKSASEENKQNTAKIIKDLEDFGIKNTDIQTQYYNVYPKYSYTDNEEKFLGYNVTHGMRVTVRDINKVSDVLDIAANSGVTSSTDVSFDVENKDKYYEQALNIAIKNAVSKGTAMADAVGVDELVIESMYESSTYTYGVSTPNIMYDSVKSSQVQPGSISIYASVNVNLAKPTPNVETTIMQ